YLKDYIYGILPIIITSIIEFDENKFVNFDLTILIYEILKPGITVKDIRDYRSIKYINLLNNPYRLKGLNAIYIGIFTNYANKKYYKTIKRINTIIGSYIFLAYDENTSVYEKGREYKYRNFLLEERKK